MFSIPVNLSKKIIINTDIERVQKSLVDLQQWNSWSPWSCLDKNVITKIDEKTYCWDSQYIGVGKMTITFASSVKIHTSLEFFKPFKSKSESWFDLKDLGNSTTEVSWSMESKLPFFLFFLKKMMTAFMGRDFERGLSRLKEYLETGTVACQLSDVENKEIECMYIYGVRKKSNLSTLSQQMDECFGEISKWIEGKEIALADGYISIYHSLDPISGDTEFTSGLYYLKEQKFPHKHDFTKIPKHHGISLTLTGAYPHLATAWSKLMCYQRAHKIKENKSIPIYERYLNSPHEVPATELKTEICEPIRHSST